MRLLAEGQGEEAAKLEEEIDDLSSQYDLLQAEIRSKSPRYAALTQPQPLDLAGIREKVIDSETLLLEYSLGEERSYLWAVSQGKLRSHELPPRAEIEEAARHLYELLTARLPVPDETAKEARRRVREADEAYWAAAGELSEMLLGPVAEVLGGRRLLVVSDGALQFLPFAALPVPGTADEPVPLIVRHEVVHLPSASALGVLRERERGAKTSDRTVAVLADPVFEGDDPRVASKTAPASQTSAESDEMEEPATELAESSMQSALRAVGFMQDGQISIPRLVATRREARAIARLAPDRTSFTALGFDANLATARSPELGRYPIVHFATHGLVNSENPALSGILLSLVDESGEPQPGFLTLDDIYDLDLPADLVVLSACSTALGKEIRGEGLVGIVRGFLYAGAERVVASLWKVDDNATGELMKRFYRHMLEEKRSPAAALRQAQIEMWREREFRPPFYWAAFVLQGEWR
jgi:CHAT domain-containing protein